jgi:hypothetical protein
LGRTRVGISALKIDEELRVRIVISTPLGDEQGQLRFADAPMPLIPVMQARL